jgi:hypothetical protein
VVLVLLVTVVFVVLVAVLLVALEAVLLVLLLVVVTTIVVVEVDPSVVVVTSVVVVVVVVVPIVVVVVGSVVVVVVGVTHVPSGKQICPGGQRLSSGPDRHVSLSSSHPVLTMHPLMNGGHALTATQSPVVASHCSTPLQKAPSSHNVSSPIGRHESLASSH